MDEEITFDKVKILTKEKKDLLYKRINGSIKYLNFAKEFTLFLYAVDKDFVVRLYKKLLKYMIKYKIW